MIPYGVFAIALGYTLVEYIGNFLLCIISSRMYGYSLKERISDLIKPLFSSILMALCGYVLTFTSLSTWMLFISQVFVCSSVYIILQILIKDSNLQYIIQKVDNR